MRSGADSTLVYGREAGIVAEASHLLCTRGNADGDKTCWFAGFAARPLQDWFTGTVRIDPLFKTSEPARCGGVERNLRARCAYRMAYPPLGQTLIIVAGVGRAQREGGPGK